jgi:hypothetical protein
MYKDLARIVFEVLRITKVIENILGQEIPKLLDFLEPGNIWEIITQGYGIRV